jgi:hypothetical protein
MYKTTIKGAVLGLIVGAVVGGAVLGALETLANGSLVGVSPVVFFFSERTLEYTYLWIVSLVLFGSLPWVVLHKMGRRGLLTAAMVGFVIPFLVIGSVSTLSLLVPNATSGVDGHVTVATLLNALESASLFGLLGVLVATVVWRIAYTKVP